VSNHGDLNDHLQRAFRKRESEPTADADANLPARSVDASEIVEVPAPNEQYAMSEVAHEKMGVISRLKARNAESAHELQKARLTYETEMGLLRHKADAAIRESRAFWDARSVEVAETIKTYVQSTVRVLEIDRLDSRNEDLQRAYESASTALQKAKSSSLPEVMKDRLIHDILTNFEQTVERIQNDTTVARYDLDQSSCLYGVLSGLASILWHLPTLLRRNSVSTARSNSADCSSDGPDWFVRIFCAALVAGGFVVLIHVLQLITATIRTVQREHLFGGLRGFSATILIAVGSVILAAVCIRTCVSVFGSVASGAVE